MVFSLRVLTAVFFEGRILADLHYVDHILNASDHVFLPGLVLYKIQNVRCDYVRQFSAQGQLRVRDALVCVIELYSPFRAESAQNVLCGLSGREILRLF